MLEYLTPKCAPAAIAQQCMVHCWAHDDPRTQVVHARVSSMNSTHNYFETKMLYHGNFILHSFPSVTVDNVDYKPLDLERF